MTVFRHALGLLEEGKKKLKLGAAPGPMNFLKSANNDPLSNQGRAANLVDGEHWLAVAGLTNAIPLQQCHTYVNDIELPFYSPVTIERKNQKISYVR